MISFGVTRTALTTTLVLEISWKSEQIGTLLARTGRRPDGALLRGSRHFLVDGPSSRASLGPRTSGPPRAAGAGRHQQRQRRRAGPVSDASSGPAFQNPARHSDKGATARRRWERFRRVGHR